MKINVGQNGFTMVEIIVSFVLLLTLGGMALSVISSGSQVVASTQDSVAYSVARGFLEQCYEFVSEDLWSAAGQRLSTVNPMPQGTAVALNGNTFTIGYVVSSENNGDAIEDYRKAVMTVTW
jgi:type II secretory pathway pseudopilin PulG